MSLVPPSHRRILPHVDLSEQGLRELEIWLMDKLLTLINQLRGSGIFYDIRNRGGFLSIETTGQSDLGWNNNPGLVLVVGVDSPDDGAGDFLLEVGRDWNIDDVGRDWNFDLGNDWNMNVGRDWNIQFEQDVNLFKIGRDFNANTVRDTNLFSGGNTAIAAGRDFASNPNVIADANVTLKATRDVVLIPDWTGSNFAQTSPPTPHVVKVPFIPASGAGTNQWAFGSDGTMLLTENSVERFKVEEDATTTVNLANGSTVVINDHLGSPLVTYTG